MTIVTIVLPCFVQARNRACILLRFADLWRLPEKVTIINNVTDLVLTSHETAQPDRHSNVTPAATQVDFLVWAEGVATYSVQVKEGASHP